MIVLCKSVGNVLTIYSRIFIQSGQLITKAERIKSSR